GERNPDLVVEVSFRLQGGPRRFQDRGDQLLRRRLSRRPRDRYDTKFGEPPSPGMGDPSQRSAGVRRGEARGSASGGAQFLPDARRRSAGNEHGGSAVLGGLGGERARVVLLADQGDEERALHRLARI